MTLSYSFNKHLNLVNAKGSGNLSAQDFRDYSLNLLQNPEIASGFLELQDYRGVEESHISLEEMKNIIEFDETSGRPVASKLAFIARTDYGYGTLRQYKAFVESEEREIEVFFDIEEAKKWLGIEGMELV